MKRLIFLLLLVPGFTFAQYKPVDQGSALNFTIRNFGFDVTGSFSGVSGNINFDPVNPVDARFDVSIDASTVKTGNDLRDEHLKEESYFDVKNYPRIRLVSTKVIAAKNGSYLFSGKLTIKDKTKDVSFPFTATPSADGYIFKGSFKINRKDFGVGGTSTIADELEVSINVTAKKTVAS